MRSLIFLLFFLGLAGAAGYSFLFYLANLEPTIRTIEQPVNPELFER